MNKSLLTDETFCGDYQQDYSQQSVQCNTLQSYPSGLFSTSVIAGVAERESDRAGDDSYHSGYAAAIWAEPRMRIGLS